MISISFSFRYAPIEGRNAVVIDVPCELIDGGKKMLFSPLSSDLPNQRSCSESFRRTEANKSIVPHGSRTPRMSRLPTCSSTSFCESRSSCSPRARANRNREQACAAEEATGAALAIASTGTKESLEKLIKSDSFMADKKARTMPRTMRAP